MSSQNNIYAQVILPLKLKMGISYLVPLQLEKRAVKGAKVRVIFARREYIAVISELTDNCGDYKGRISEILSVEEVPPVSEKELRFWQWCADYYMCTVGEVYRAAFTSAMRRDSAPKRVRKQKPSEVDSRELYQLSPAQEQAREEIMKSFAQGKPALLAGVTGSGKTEIYLKIAKEITDKGGRVLYMVPEIALSRQLNDRLEAVFGERLLSYHSGMTPAARYSAYSKIDSTPDGEGFIVLGLRSSLFLPFRNLELIIIDEEHDSSYKQTEPAPRYNGRDSAIVLGQIHSAPVLLGSATPSFESLYNCSSGRYSLVRLDEKFHGATEPEVTVIDTIRESKAKRMNGLFSQTLLEEIESVTGRGEQVLIFRNRRSYSPLVQCSVCGHIPMCSHCNVPLSYHKNRGELCCHYCDYHIPRSSVCPECSEPGMTEKGSGTEMIEEKIREILPNARVARFDAETTQSKAEEKRILREFAAGKIDILVGTQMISKGFDFKGLSLVALIQADSMLAMDDFRANERAFQLLRQLSGRTGRGAARGKIIIQTSLAAHNVYEAFSSGEERLYEQLAERQEFGYPPFVRLIKLTIRSADRNRLSDAAARTSMGLGKIKSAEITGPFAPVVDKVRGEYILQFWIKLPRAGNAAAKERIAELAEKIEIEIRSVTIVADVDPQ